TQDVDRVGVALQVDVAVDKAVAQQVDDRRVWRLRNIDRLAAVERRPAIIRRLGNDGAAVVVDDQVVAHARRGVAVGEDADAIGRGRSATGGNRGRVDHTRVRDGHVVET